MRGFAVLGGVALVAMLLAGPGASSAHASKQHKTPISPQLLGFTPNTRPTVQDFRRMAHAGATTIRFQLGWAGLQPEQDGPINWKAADRYVKRASRVGLSLDFLLGTTPDWARSSPDVDRWAPPMSSGFAKVEWMKFVAAAAQRYGHDGYFWQEHPDYTYRPVTWTVWNEPNLPRYWGGPPDPEEFADLVRITGSVLHTYDPEGKIVTGGLFCQGPWKSFLAQFYQHADQSSFDYIGFHPYDERPFGVNRIMLGGREIMNRSGDRDGGTWIDEISWGTDVSQHRFTYSPKQQARRMRILFQAFSGERQSLNLGKVMWYGFRDDPGSNICHFCASSGLWFEGGTKAKPAWYVYKGFGTEPAAGIRGRVYHGHDRPASRQTVYVDLNDNGSHQTGEPEVTTAANGRYSFSRLFPTKHVVRLLPSTNKACKGGCSRTTKVVSGKTARKQRFFVKNAPRTMITTAKVGPRNATFRFKAFHAHPPYRFSCKLDHRHYRDCSSPQGYKNLNPGEHKLSVRAKDAKGTVDRTPAKEKFEITG